VVSGRGSFDHGFETDLGFGLAVSAGNHKIWQRIHDHSALVEHESMVFTYGRQVHDGDCGRVPSLSICDAAHIPMHVLGRVGGAEVPDLEFADGEESVQEEVINDCGVFGHLQFDQVGEVINDETEVVDGDECFAVQLDRCESVSGSSKRVHRQQGFLCDKRVEGCVSCSDGSPHDGIVLSSFSSRNLVAM
jgi:hypothetical protein